MWHAGQLIKGEIKQIRLSLDDRRAVRTVGQRGRGNLTKPFDVEPTSRPDVFDPATHLCRAAARIRAAQVDVARFHGTQLSTTLGTLARHDERLLTAIAQVNDRTEHLGNHIAGFANHHGVTDQHALGLDHILIVQGGPGHGGTGHAHRFEHGIGRDPTSAAHTHFDAEQLGVDLFGRVLVGDRPTRRS